MEKASLFFRFHHFFSWRYRLWNTNNNRNDIEPQYRRLYSFLLATGISLIWQWKISHFSYRVDFIFFIWFYLPGHKRQQLIFYKMSGLYIVCFQNMITIINYSDLLIGNTNRLPLLWAGVSLPLLRSRSVTEAFQ